MRNLFLTLCLLFSLNSFAQHTIRGKIIDKDSKEVINYGYITLSKNNKSLKTAVPDENGIFIFDNFPKGDYIVEIKVMGYSELKSKNIELNRDIDMGVIELSPESFALKGVEVVRQKNQVVYKLDKKVISASANIIASGGGTASDILSKIPSIRVDADGGISFRGSSGFLVQVNGKPSMFNAAQALQQIPAEQIENIEIITIPSARHETEGDAGIINIVTKKQYGEGLQGTVNAFGSTYGSRGLDFTLNKKTGEHRFRVGGIYSQRLRKSDFEQEKSTIVADTTTVSHSKGPRRGEFYSYILQAGWQWEKKQTDIYIDFTGGYEGWKNKGDLIYSERINIGGINKGNNEYKSKDDYDLHETLFAGNIGFNHKFTKEDHTLKGSFYIKYGGNALENFKSDLVNNNNKRMRGHEAWEAEHRWTVDGRLDYVYPYSDLGRIETGYQYSSYLEDGDYKMEYWNPVTEKFDYRSDIYNTFYFQRGINTIYLLANQRAGKFEFQAGVRGEHTHQVLRSSKEWANRTENRFELFPSVHVGYNPNETTNLTAAYSRRTNRPQLFFMEPYITFRDYYTAEIGNPDIRPEYINSFELSFKKNIGEQIVQIAAFHRNRTDKIERLRIPYEAGITLDSMANVGRDYSTGFEFGLNIKTGTVWSFVANGNVFHYKVKNKIASGGKNESSINCGFSLNNNFQLAKNTTMQLDASYIGPTVQTQGKQYGFFYTDFGIRQLFLSGKLSASLSYRNFLNTAKYKSNINTENLVSQTTISPKYPLITLSIGYVFNNFKQRSQDRGGSDFFEGTNY